MCSTLQQPTPTYIEPHARHFVVVAVLKWEAAEEAIHQIVTHSDDQFSLTYEDLKKMLDWKDRLEELSVKCKTLVSYLVSCSRLGRPCHIELLRARARVCLCFGPFIRALVHKPFRCCAPLGAVATLFTACCR